MITNQEALSEFDVTATTLLQTFKAFSPRQFNTIPFEGSWTAGQVGDHLLQSAVGLPTLLQDTTQETDRPIDAKAEIISTVFLDFTTKLKAPDFIIPSDGPHDKAALLQSLTTTLDAIKSTARSVDLAKTCTSFALPQIGELTGLEWIHFVTCHIKRHTWQLNNIYNIVAVTAS